MSNFFNNYPYTDFHELNLDWVINKIKKIQDDIKSYEDDNDSIKKLVDDIQNDIDELNKWKDTINTEYISNIVKKYVSTMVYVFISNNGYIIYYIPDNWDDVHFNTTGLDISNNDLIDNGHIGNYDYGRLVLSLYE